MIENIDGLNIYYEAAGEGETVLLLHGWGCSTQTLAPVFDRLKQRYYVVSMDFPGHGNSSTPEKPMSVSNFASITLELMRRLDILGCKVVAHSFGARVTIKLAAQDSSIFDKIVFTGGAGIRPKRGFTYYRKVYTYKLCKRLAKIGFVNKLLMLFGVDIRKKVANAGSADYKALSDTMRATFSRVVNEDLSKQLQEIKNPTLLIWGTEDRETPLWMAEKMEKHIGDCGLVKLEGAGHFAYLDRFEDFIIIVSHFL